MSDVSFDDHDRHWIDVGRMFSCAHKYEKYNISQANDDTRSASALPLTARHYLI